MGGRSAGRSFSADQSILKRRDDLLSRAPFAKNIATALRGWKGKESLVLGLFGPWGSGKSSVKNLVIEELERSKRSCPTIIQLNPWQLAGQEQLTLTFFREIGIALGRSDDAAKGKTRAEKWNYYSRLLSLGSRLANPLSEAAALLGVPLAGVLGKRLGKAMENASEAAKEGAEGLNAKAKADERSLEDIKRELAALCRDLERPILVVMDDVDRLTSSQIYHLFQLAKCNADFPNMVFMILCQRSIVEDALHKETGMPGRDFLEKIVQVNFDLPLVDHSLLEKALLSSLDRILSRSSAKAHFDTNRWANVYYSGLNEFFKTMRDVNRFLSSLAFHIEVFERGRSFEVSPVDLIAIEAIRLFEPDVYAAIGREQAALTGRNAATLRFDDDKEVKPIIEGIVAAAKPERRPYIKGMLRHMFPLIAHHLGAFGRTTTVDAEWFVQRRICHPDVFLKFFVFGPPSGDISQADIDRCLEAAKDRAAFVREMRTLAKRGLLGVLMNRLEAYKDTLPLKLATAFITGLLDIADFLPEEPTDSSRLFSPTTNAKRVVYWYLIREPDENKRGEVLKKAIEESTGLYLPCELAESELHLNAIKSSTHPLVSKVVADGLAKSCQKRLREAAGDGRLLANPFVKDLIGYYVRWMPAEAKAWMAEVSKTKEGALEVLVNLARTSTISNMEDRLSRRRWHISLGHLERFIDVTQLTALLEDLEETKLNEAQSKSLRAFRHAREGDASGKVDKKAWVDDVGEAEMLP